MDCPPSIHPFFLAIPGLVLGTYMVNQLQQSVECELADMDDRLTQVERKSTRYVHNGFREAYRDHFK